uniref:Uncharacterized protein n=1 Tax=Romanomermis culicivorax TaxID=13658 RepID=A0A915KMI2_ROMCU
IIPIREGGGPEAQAPACTNTIFCKKCLLVVDGVVTVAVVAVRLQICWPKDDCITGLSAMSILVEVEASCWQYCCCFCGEE